MYEKHLKNNAAPGGNRRPSATPGDTHRNDENKALRRRGSRARREEGDRRRGENREIKWSEP